MSLYYCLWTTHQQQVWLDGIHGYPWVDSVPHLLQTECLTAGLHGLDMLGSLLERRGELLAIEVVEASPLHCAATPPVLLDSMVPW